MPHHLKSLELQGYKTFASRHEFEFAGTITAIVGPNGSGKSNIVDAIRWVLGEQSYNLLRGKRTDDMIFSGSETRSRAGMASVSVGFDNSDGWLPIDFSEVSITRRAYRDGQNEYLINGQKVRLKDVTELLAQSGLAERTYTIIGQGLVDAALSLRAEERRRLFEEAAGIGLHRSRREEALRRLETTHRNLDRVQDILAELQPRLRSLERQARRSQEYEQIQADLRVILREWYGFYWHNSQKDLVRVREYAEIQEKHLNEVRNKQDVLNKQVAQGRDELQALRSRLNSWHRQLASLHSQREQIGRELAVADERTRSFHEQKVSTENELNRLEEEISLLESRRETIREDLVRNQLELSHAADQFDLAQQAYQKRLQERLSVEKQLSEVRKINADLQTKKNQLLVRLSERTTQLDRYQNEFVEAETALYKAKQAVEDAQKNLDLIILQQHDVSEARQKIEQKYRNHQERLEKTDLDRRNLYTRLAEARAESARLNAQMNVLAQAEQSLIGYSEGTRLLLEAARSAHLRGAAGALSSQLEVSADYEIAIAASLGEFLDAVILNDKTQVDQALDVVTEKHARGALLPLNQILVHEPVKIQQKDGILGLASNYVRVSPELQPAIDLLLGSTILVVNRKMAREALIGMPVGVRAVTLHGEIFHANGLVSTSSPGSENDTASSLSRSRQQRELLKTSEIKNSEISRLENEYASLVSKVDEFRNDGRILADELERMRQSERGKIGEFERARIALEREQEQVNWYTKRLEQFRAEITHSTNSLKEYRATQTEIQDELNKTQENLRDIQKSLGNLPEDEFLEQVNHWKTNRVVLSQANSALQLRLGEVNSQIDRLISARDELFGRRNAFTQASQEIEDEKLLQREKDQEIAFEIENLQKLVQPSEIELEQLENRHQKIQEEDESIRQVYSAAEHRYAQARINLNKQLDALDSLRRRIEDDFGLVEFEYEQTVSGPTPLPLDGMVEKLPVVTEVSADLEDILLKKRAQLRRMGAVNPEAQKEYLEVKERFEFMTAQVADLEKAEADIRQAVAELDQLMQQEFQRTFEIVAEEFKLIFSRLFGGGSAQLLLTDPSDMTNTGIDIEARLPGRRAQGLSLLSGGERSLTATALVFALLKTSPTPFCVLDEVDAMLDEANVGRFRELLKELSTNTQFIIITHNRNTVQAADVIYGVTMGKDSASQVLSLKLDQVSVIANHN
jgi:chromosome segregation protein